MTLLRLVHFDDPAKRPVVDFDLADVVSTFRERDSFQIQPQAPASRWAQRDDRFGGSRSTGETRDNTVFQWSLLLRSSVSAVAMWDSLEALLKLLTDAGSRQGGTRFLEFRPTGLARSVYMEVRGTPSWTPDVRESLISQQATLADFQFPVAPTARLDSMDIWDDFSANSLADYTAVVGAIGDVQVDANAQVLKPLVGAALTAERRLRHTARNYSHLDDQRTVQFTPGATITNYRAGVTLRDSAAGVAVLVYVDDNGTNSRLRIDVNGVNRSSTNLAARVANGVSGWVRGRIEGNLVFAEYFTAVPTPMATPTLSATYQLTAAEVAALPAAPGGLDWIPQDAAATLDDYRAEPFTYRNRPLPDDVKTLGTVPGSAPALCELTLTPSGGTDFPVFALAAWCPRPGVWSRVWNGNFETDTGGWAVTAVANISVAATSITRDTSSARFGTANGQIVTPATLDSGAQFHLFRRVKRGVTYTAQAWVRAPASTTVVYVRVGNSGANDKASSGTVALSANWQLISVQWTPAADYDDVYVAVNVGAATATTFQIDGAAMFEGTVAPTMLSQVEGRGAQPPFGLIEAESADTLTTWAITADATRRGGYYLAATAAGAGTAHAEWFIDPALLTRDDFTEGEVDIEVFCRPNLASTLVTPTLKVTAFPAAGATFGPTRLPHEPNGNPKALVVPTAVAHKVVRLGTLTLPVQSAAPARWKLAIDATWAAGSTGNFFLDYLHLAIVKRRASSPTGKPKDATYPSFVRSTAETSKTVRSDKSAFVTKDGARIEDQGLPVGSMLLLPPGDLDWTFDLSNVVPDDPVASSLDEVLNKQATVHLMVIPQVFVARGS
jgi:hypothetical protein